MTSNFLGAQAVRAAPLGAATGSDGRKEPQLRSRRLSKTAAVALMAMGAMFSGMASAATTTSGAAVRITPIGVPVALTRELAIRLLTRTGFQPSKQELDEIMEARTVETAINWILEGRNDGTKKFPQRPTADYDPRSPGWFFSARVLFENCTKIQWNGTPEAKACVADQAAKLMEFWSWHVWHMAVSKSPIVERMALFWHNHFALRLPGSWASMAFDNHNKIRRNAIGDFKTMLMDMVEDPSMLVYLSQHLATAHAGAPTANFARELLELHTVGAASILTGKPNYTENNILDVARVLAGLSWNRDTLTYTWRDEFHDYKTPWKEVLPGRRIFTPAKLPADKWVSTSGPGQAEYKQLVRMLLNDPNTARRIVSKLWKEFVSEEEPDANTRLVIAQIGDNLRLRYNYDIRKVLADIFMRPEFWDPKNTLVKTPVEYVVGAVREIGLPNGSDFMYASGYTLRLDSMGYRLFFVPSVKGFDTGTASISNMSLGARQGVATQLAWLWSDEILRKNLDPANPSKPPAADKLLYGFLWNGNRNTPLSLADFNRMRADRFTVQPMFTPDGYINDPKGNSLTPYKAQELILADPAYQLK